MQGKQVTAWLLGLLLLAAVGGAAYWGWGEMESLKKETAFCGQPGCEQLAGEVQSLQTSLKEHQGKGGKATELEAEVKRLSAERDGLAQEVAACGEAGCAALAGKLAAKEEELATLQAKVGELEQSLAEARKTAEELAAKVGADMAREAGGKVGLEAVLKVGPFGVGGFKLDKAKLAEVEKALTPFKGETLVVVGMADARPFKGPSGDLKQLGLMLARARIVQEMGFDVYYQVRQADSVKDEDRSVIVYRLTRGPSMAEAPSGKAAGLAVPTFYRSKGAAKG